MQCEKSREMLQCHKLFLKLALMRGKFGLAIIAAMLLSGIAFVPGARADEKMSALQTALSSTTVSGEDIAQPIDTSSLSAENQISELALQMAAASHQEAANGGNLSSIFPPTPIDSSVSEAPSVFPSGLESPTSIQQTPEPSTFMLGGLSLGLIAVLRLSQTGKSYHS